MRDIFCIVMLILFTAGSAALGIIAFFSIIVNQYPWYTYFALVLPIVCTCMWFSFTCALIDHVRKQEEEKKDDQI